MKKLCVYLQYLLPQHFLSRLIGRIADSQIPWLKNFIIKRFIAIYKVDLKAAALQDINDYPSFNSFFIRELKADARPIANELDAFISPADGCIAQIGHINKNLLLQAKQTYFDLETLLGGDKALAAHFQDGSFATIYLAPADYHRVHMPIAGKLIKTIYVPGKLFSVNRMTSQLIPNLYGRNERLICVFATEAGPITVILVGAMIVGSMQTVWMKEAVRGNKILTQVFPNGREFAKGDLLGYFKMGSTVVLLSAKDKIQWQPQLTADVSIKMGSLLGKVGQ